MSASIFLAPSRGLWSRAWKLRRMRIAVGLWAVLSLLAASADFLAPYRPEAQSTSNAYAPPARLHFVGPDGFSLRPFVYRTVVRFDSASLQRTVAEDRSVRYPVRFFARGASYRLWGLFPTNVHLFSLGGDADRVEARLYLWGADRFGRDVFTRTLFGGRVSLAVGPLVVLLLVPLALLVGGLSGLAGRRADAALQRVGEAVGSIPSLPVVLVVGAVLSGAGVPPAVRLAGLLGGLAAVGWPSMARVVRGQVLSLREREFALAARACGGRRMGVLVRDLLPHVATTAAVSAALLLPGAMLLEASLSFLGLGLAEPTPSWGALLAGAANLSALAGAPWLLVPGAFVVVSALAAQLAADAVRDAAGPSRIPRDRRLARAMRRRGAGGRSS